MRLETVKTVFAKEMLETFRDRRTLAVSVFIPIMMLPLTMGLFKYFGGDRVPEYRYVVSGGTAADSDVIRELLAEEERARLVAVTMTDPDSALKVAEIELIVRLQGPLAVPGEATSPVTLRHGPSKESRLAASLVAARLESYGEELTARRLARRGLEADLMDPLPVTLENAMPESDPSMAGVIFPLIVLIWIAVGAMYPAADVTAGEKDRRTIGDLLLTPATRVEITVGKFMAVFALALITLMVATVSTLVGVELGDIAQLRLDAGGATRAALVWMIPVALLTTAIVTALEMIASLFAKSFREAQTYLTPIFMCMLIPGGLLAMAPDLAHKEWLYWVPFMNNSLIIRELLLNVIDPVHLTAVLLTSLAGSIGLVAVMVGLFNREEVLFRT